MYTIRKQKLFATPLLVTYPPNDGEPPAAWFPPPKVPPLCALLNRNKRGVSVYKRNEEQNDGMGVGIPDQYAVHYYPCKRFAQLYVISAHHSIQNTKTHHLSTHPPPKLGVPPDCCPPPPKALPPPPKLGVPPDCLPKPPLFVRRRVRINCVRYEYKAKIFIKALFTRQTLFPTMKQSSYTL